MTDVEIVRGSPRPTSGGGPEARRVLLVEDQPSDARLLTLALGSATDVVFVVENAVRLGEAIDRLDRERFDVVLLDLGLPDSSGLETFTRLIARHGAVPVIVLTGLSDDQLALHAVHAGAQDYVVKGSVEDGQLVRVVRYAIERYELKIEIERLAARQAVLARLSRRALEDAPADELLAEACQRLTEAVDVPVAFILERLADGRWLVRAAHGMGSGIAGTVTSLPPPWERGALPTLLAPLVVEDALDGGSFLAPPPFDQLRSAIVVGFDAGGFDGLLAIHDRVPRRFDGEVVAFITATASVLSEALRRGEAEHGLSERIKELTTLATVGRLTQRALTPQVLVERVAEALRAGMQWPDDVVVDVRADHHTATTGGDPAALTEQLHADIVVAGTRRGRVTVGYTRPRGFLLPYEQQLVDAVAETMALWVERHDAVSGLAEREQRLRFVIDNLPGMVVVVDRDLRLLSHLGQAHAVLGLEPDAFVGRDARELFGDGARVVAAARTAIANGVSGFHEERLAGRTWDVHVEPLRHPSGAISGAIGIALDTTETQEARAELEASRRRLRGLFENALDAIFLTDDDGRYVDANPAACQLTGYSSEELLELSVLDLTPESAQRDFPAEWKAFRTAGTGSGEYSLRRKDGELLEVEFRAVADVVDGVHLSVLRDNTDRRRAQRDLHRSERRFRSLVQNATDLIVLLDLHGKILWASPAVGPVLGYAPEEMEGLDGFALVHHEDEPRMRDFWARAISSNDPAAPDPYRVRHRDGAWRWIEQTVTNLADDPAVNAIVLNGRDVTKRHEAEIALRRSEERFRRLADNAQDLIYRLTLEPELHFDYISGAIGPMLGYDADELYADGSLLLRSIVHPDDRARWTAGLSEIDEEEASTVRWLRRDGSPLWIEEHRTGIREEGGRLLAIESIVRDVTARELTEEALRDALAREREAADRLRKVDEMKDTFLTAVSHELRTPLTSVRGFAELLFTRRQQLPEGQVDHLLKRLLHNSERLDSLLADLLDLQRLTGGGALNAETDEVDLATLVRAVLDEIDPRGHIISTEVDPVVARVDAGRLERVVHNLVANAVRHTPAGAAIWVRLVAEGDDVHLRVEDSGPGIPDVMKRAIFEPFRTGDSPAAKVEGAGIGLSLVDRFAQLHGGRAWVEDRVGGGASFHVLLPACAPRSGTGAAQLS